MGTGLSPENLQRLETRQHQMPIGCRAILKEIHRHYATKGYAPTFECVMAKQINHHDDKQKIECLKWLKQYGYVRYDDATTCVVPLRHLSLGYMNGNTAVKLYEYEEYEDMYREPLKEHVGFIQYNWTLFGNSKVPWQLNVKRVAIRMMNSIPKHFIKGGDIVIYRKYNPEKDDIKNKLVICKRENKVAVRMLKKVDESNYEVTFFSRLSDIGQFVCPISDISIYYIEEALIRGN